MSINLSSINLNLLIVLDALLIEPSTTRAATRLNSTQPTVSKALIQLRDIFDDELLVRAQAGRMYLTPKAKSLKEPVREVISKLKNIFIEEEPFRPELLTNTFNIGIGEHNSILLLSKLMQVLNETAPNVRFRTYHIEEYRTINEIDMDKLDLIICPDISIPSSMESQTLFVDTHVCVADKKHPVINKDEFTIADFLAYSHILVTVRKRITDNSIEKALRHLNIKREIATVVPHVTVALSMLENSEHYCIVQKKLAEKLKDNFNLVYRALPFESSGLNICQHWKKENNGNAPHLWLRQTIHNIALNL